MRLRLRYFSDGLVLGNREFVEGVFQENRDKFGLKRKNGALGVSENESAGAAKLAPEHHDGDHQANPGDNMPHALRLDALRILRPKIIADQGARRQRQRLRPVHHTRADEPHRRHDIDEAAEQVFQRVHLVDVRHAHEAERGEHQDADSRTKKRAVDGHG